jgi:hypothetical protein
MDPPVAFAPAPVHAFASAATPRSQLRKKMDPPAAFAPTPVHAFASAATPVASFARRWTRARRLRPGTRPRFCKRGYPRSQLRKKMDRPVAFAPTPVHAFASAATRSQLRKKMDRPVASAPTPVHAFASAATPVASFARRWTRARRLRPGTRPRFCKRGYPRSQLRKKMDPPVASAPGTRPRFCKRGYPP